MIGKLRVSKDMRLPSLVHAKSAVLRAAMRRHKRQGARGHSAAANGPLRIMVVGQRNVDAGWWRNNGLSLLADVRLGAPSTADVTLLIGEVPPELVSTYHDVTTRNLISTWPVAPGCSGEQWAKRVVEEAENTGVDVVFFLFAGEDDLAALERLTRTGIATAIMVSSSDLARLNLRSRKLPPGEILPAASVLAKAGLIVTASSWECEKVRELTGGHSDVYAYLRGVDLEGITVREPGGREGLRLLYVADDGGPVSLRRVLKAAQDLESNPLVRFTVLSRAEVACGANTIVAAPVAGDERLAIYHRFDAIISPIEGTGFSSALMEALASGCAGLVPRPYFGGYSSDAPFATYGIRDGELAATIASLAGDAARLRALQGNGPPFAQAYFDRRQWGQWLEGSLDWLGRGGGKRQVGH